MLGIGFRDSKCRQVTAIGRHILSTTGFSVVSVNVVSSSTGRLLAHTSKAEASDTVHRPTQLTNYRRNNTQLANKTSKLMSRFNKPGEG